MDILEIMNIPYYKKGNTIHIKKENRGKFTRSAKEHNMGVLEFATHVLNNKDEYSPTLIKRANFAKNSKKFKHAKGGLIKKCKKGEILNNQPISYKTYKDYKNLTNVKQGILEGLAMLQYADNKAIYGDNVPEEAKYLYDMGLLPEIEVTADRDLTKKESYLADLLWRNYLATHPIQISSEEYNRLPEKAKAQVYKNKVTDAIDKATLPTAAVIIAPTALTAGAASLAGSGALTAAADAAGKVGTKIAGFEVGPGVTLGQTATTFINNPFVNLGFGILGGISGANHFNQTVDNIKNKNYSEATGNALLTALDISGGLYGLNKGVGGVKPLINNLKNKYISNYTIKKPLISKSIITDSKTGELLYTPDEVVNSGDFVKGKEMAVKFFEHPVVLLSYKHNLQLAKRLGITIPDKNPSQIVSQPVKVKYENLGNNTVANVAQSYYGDPDAIISMNWKYYPLNTIRQGVIHENLHRGWYSAPLRPAVLDKEYYNTIYKPEYIFWDWKTKKLLKPEYHNSYLADISGGEAGPNFIDLGRDLGLKLGQKYPGYDKVTDMLNKYNGNKSFMIKLLNDSKAGMRHVWDAMTGKYFILPLIGGSTYYKLNNINNEK